jgi:hypothetical protein
MFTPTSYDKMTRTKAAMPEGLEAELARLSDVYGNLDLTEVSNTVAWEVRD